MRALDDFESLLRRTNANPGLGNMVRMSKRAQVDAKPACAREDSGQGLADMIQLRGIMRLPQLNAPPKTSDMIKAACSYAMSTFGRKEELKFDLIRSAFSRYS